MFCALCGLFLPQGTQKRTQSSLLIALRLVSAGNALPGWEFGEL
jgi:hypothetical protein